MLRPRVVSRLLFCAVVGCGQPGAVIITDLDAHSLPDDTPWDRVLSVAPGWPVPFQFEKTTKGNGGLTFPGGFARIYDAHDDGIVFDPYLLDTRLADLDGDGFADIELRGTAVFHDDKGTREIGRRRVRAVFTFVPAQRRFVETASDESIYTQTR